MSSTVSSEKSRSIVAAMLSRGAILLLSLLVLPPTTMAADQIPSDNVEGQAVVQRDGPDITRLRWIDDEGRQPITYGQWMSARGPEQPFQMNLTGRSQTKAAADGIKFCIIVNSTLRPQIQTSLDQYVIDLTEEGYEVETYETSGGTPEDIRAFLQGRYALGLVGCVLVGDLPVPWYEADCWDDPVEHEQFPCDLFYMDLDGLFIDADTDGLYDWHEGNVAPEIWVGRLTASPLTLGGGTEASLIQNYFTKNHDYRAGTAVLNSRALVYIDDDWATASWGTDVGLAYADRILVNDVWTTWASDYKVRLVQNWESILVCGHSSPFTQYFTNPNDQWSTITNSEVRTLHPVAHFYNLFACSHARYVEGNYSAGWYTFNATNGLVSIGSTKTGSMLDFQYFYAPFGSGATIGEALRQWFTDIIGGGNYQDWQVCWHFGMTMIGDPTLKKADVVTISGTVHDGSGQPIAGVTMNGFSGSPVPVTQPDGTYSCPVASGWSGTVTPSAPVFRFLPESRTYSNVTASQNNQNFLGVTDICTIAVSAADGIPDAGEVRTGKEVSFNIRFMNPLPNTHAYNLTSGWRVYSPDGAVFSPAQIAALDNHLEDAFGSNLFLYAWDGAGSDSLGAAGIAFPPYAGIPIGLDEDVIAISTTIDPASDGLTICVDSSFCRHGAIWEWAPVAGAQEVVRPVWQGPYCFTVVDCSLHPESEACQMCCDNRVGDANGVGGDEPTIGDISTIVDAKFITGTCEGILECFTEADVNQSGGFDPDCDDITIGDISTLIDYLFITGPSLLLPECL